MKNLSLFASALAVLGLTACEKTLVDDIADVGNGQVKNSVLQVRTRAGGSADEATVTYPVTVYVFAGDEYGNETRELYFGTMPGIQFFCWARHESLCNFGRILIPGVGAAVS